MSELNYRNHISFTDQGYNLLDIVIKSQKVNNDYLFREILLDDCNPEDLKSVCINKSETNKPFLDVIEEIQENITDKNDLIEGSYYLISTNKKINNPLLEINRNPENFNYIVKYQLKMIVIIFADLVTAYFLIIIN